MQFKLSGIQTFSHQCFGFVNANVWISTPDGTSRWCVWQDPLFSISNTEKKTYWIQGHCRVQTMSCLSFMLTQDRAYVFRKETSTWYAFQIIGLYSQEPYIFQIRKHTVHITTASEFTTIMIVNSQITKKGQHHRTAVLYKVLNLTITLEICMTHCSLQFVKIIYLKWSCSVEREKPSTYYI